MKNARLIAILVLVFLLGVLIVQNTAPVETRFLFITVQMPQIVLLLLTVGGGFGLGVLVSMYLNAKPKKKAKVEEI